MHMHHHHHRGSTTVIVGGGIVNAVVMIVVGLVLVGMGVSFFSIGNSTPILHDSFLPTGGILAVIGVVLFVVGIVMWVRRKRTPGTVAGGIQGHATIVGMNQTGLLVNGQPVVDLQLQITSPVHASYVVARRETVPAAMMGRLMSGHPLPVMVDATRPENVVISWDLMMRM